ncbi:ABC transporter ATP-binding protein [Mesorhizobium sp. LHD-90]|uniref:ABC transporter ATP-binding protein n=1 Tax=Mesorhizobium sp. LHD-90 TaxID=3071414 RepID=UPI0027E04ABC|nr:ABC transporter ATP-binding protein [Mesorhizobium sp. LHD-90]MDQ6437204.1 ABC transporter ATP-binding protein [Mesorhizobium sp. LHD-90]
MATTSAKTSDDNEPAAILACRNVSVEFPQYGAAASVALRDVSLNLRAGEVLGLVGESGSGKTMLARAIMRLVPPPGEIAKGSIHFDGKNLAELDQESLRKIRGRDIAMIISNPRGELDPLQTVGQQIASVLRHHLDLDRKVARDRALDLLKQVSIPDPQRRLDAYPHELSGGMAQRVVIAIALACSPRFIISDDATSGLDVTVQAQVLELIRSLVSERGTSMMFITRDIGITAHYCDRIAIIYAGEIMEIAERAVFFDDPQHPYTVLLLAAFAQNERLRRYWLGEDKARENSGPSPVGCSFQNRCVRVRERCRTDHPALIERQPGHLVRCHYPVERS